VAHSRKRLFIMLMLRLHMVPVSHKLTALQTVNARVVRGFLGSFAIIRGDRPRVKPCAVKRTVAFEACEHNLKGREKAQETQKRILFCAFCASSRLFPSGLPSQ
jgi:hypothetical protein